MCDSALALSREFVALSLSANDACRLRQWFNAVQDLNPKYLEPEDHALMARIAGVNTPVQFIACDGCTLPDECREKGCGVENEWPTNGVKGNGNG